MCNPVTTKSTHPFPQNFEEVPEYLLLYFVIFVYGLLLHMIKLRVRYELDNFNRRNDSEDDLSDDSETSDTSLDELSDDSDEDSYSSGYFSNDDNYV